MDNYRGLCISPVSPVQRCSTSRPCTHVQYTAGNIYQVPSSRRNPTFAYTGRNHTVVRDWCTQRCDSENVHLHWLTSTFGPGFSYAYKILCFYWEVRQTTFLGYWKLVRNKFDHIWGCRISDSKIDVGFSSTFVFCHLSTVNCQSCHFWVLHSWNKKQSATNDEIIWCGRKNPCRCWRKPENEVPQIVSAVYIHCLH